MTPAVADAGCLVAVVGHTEAARVTAHALHQAAHRGAAGSSVAVADGVRLRCVTSQGAPHPPLTAEQLRPLVGGVAVGCLHDGDRGDALVTGHASVGQLLAAVVGRFTNGSQLRTELLEAGAVLRSGSDAELLLHLVARSSQRTFVNRLVDAVWRLEGAYSLVVGTPERLVVLRDPHGVRPLWMGHVGEATIFATDDVVVERVGGRLARQLRPGEMLIVDDRGMQSIAPLPSTKVALCSQEVLALAPAEGKPFAEPVHGLRVRLGARLSEQHPVAEADVVVGMPGVGEEFAVGFAAAAGKPLERALMPPRTQAMLPRLSAVAAAPALGLVPSAVAHRTVALVVGPLREADRVRQAVGQLVRAGAAAVHVRAIAPPVRIGCPYGQRVGPSDAVAAVRITEAEPLASWLGATSLSWLAGSDLGEVLGDGRCDACMSMQLPIEVGGGADDQLGLFDDDPR